MAAIPADLRGCFRQMVPAPSRGVLTRKQVAAIIAEFKESERAKTICGRRLLAIYDIQAEVLAK